MASETLDRRPDRRGGLQRHALQIIRAIDRHRNLPKGVAVLCFFLAGAISVKVFFLLVDLPLWQGRSDFLTQAVVAVAWVSIFPVWAAIFAAIVFLLHLCGIDDLYAEARARLARLARRPRVLRALKQTLATQNLRHRQLFERVIADLLRGSRK